MAEAFNIDDYILSRAGKGAEEEEETVSPAQPATAGEFDIDSYILDNLQNLKKK